MKRWPALIFTIGFATLLACGPAGDGLWYHGDLSAATKRAAEENTLVFVEFYTDWCSWCRRLESETLTDREVKDALSKFVAIRLNAEKDGIDAARRFGVDSYPTMIFLDPTGEEVERISGYLPPEKLVEELRRITTGDTLSACLQELEDDPTNVEAIRRAVDGLLERADPEGAIARIESFHAENGHDHDVCARLMFQAGRDLHYRVYLRAGKLYRNGWTSAIEVPPVPGSKRLADLLRDGLPELDPSTQAELMRTARFDDSLELLNIADPDKAEGDELFELGAFAFRGGHYELAADLYGRWFGETETGHSADMLNRAAWQLYLARESIDTGITMARQAYELDPSADIADTLARLLYIRGDHREAVELERKAAASAQGGRAEQYLEVADKMQRLVDLDDEPAFESYPGPREISL
jgi:tetratricopeptide (TPR) repeat protein